MCLSVGLAIAHLLLAAVTAQAKDCRTIPSVQHSLQPAGNAAAGGHIGKHIFDVQAPPGLNSSALNNTMYDTTAHWTTLITAFQALVLPHPPQCAVAGGGNVAFILPSADLAQADRVPGYECTAVSAVYAAQCITLSAHSFAPVRYAFVYKYVIPAGVQDGNWILLTAYPYMY
ncbi:MAG: hypothetical protein COB37_11710 [Kordiimonadales bacterium]|nr:MAG: hypothetical protein COB37_11710 [Kordiimonadales bacterium]